MLVLYNGNIYADGAFEEALVADGKRITFIGSNEEALKFAQNKSDLIDLDGRLLLPGFIDSHAHGPYSIELTLGKVDLTPAGTAEEYTALIRDFVCANPDMEFYSGMGWLNPAFSSLGPEKEVLDSICADRPIVLLSGDGHSVWANSKAIERAGITEDSEDPAGGTIERNPDHSIRGTFRDQAKEPLMDIVPEGSVELYKEAIRRFQNMMVEYGHTAVFDPMVEAGSNMHKAYREMAENNELLIKFGLAFTSDPENPMANLERYAAVKSDRSDKLIEGNFIKVFVDGVVEGGTAYLKQPYDHMPGYCGEALWKQEVLNEFCKAVDKLGYNLHFHVIGDAAIDQMLQAVSDLTEENGPRDRRTVAAHMQIVDAADYERLKELRISISSNPYWFVKAPGYFDNIELPSLGERAFYEYPMKTFFDLGLIVSAGSDYAVTPDPYPPAGIQLAMLRVSYDEDPKDKDRILNENEKIDLGQGLKAFTENGAYTMGIETITGALKPGMLADLVVLEENLFEIPAQDFYKTKVFLTVSEGEIVYEKKEIDP